MRLTVAEGGLSIRLGPASGERGARAIVDSAGHEHGAVAQSDDSSALVELLHGRGGLAAIVTTAQGARYICSAPARLEVEGCLVELSGSSADAWVTRDVPRRRSLACNARQSVTKQAAIAAGGSATRFAPLAGPWTGHSKPGIPITHDVSLLRALVDAVAAIGIEDVFVNTHMGAARLAAGLEGAAPRVHYLHEEQPSGTAGPLRKALRGEAFEKFDRSQPLLVLQGDALTDVDLGELVSAHAVGERSYLTLGVQRVRDEDVFKYGIVIPDSTYSSGEAFRVSGFMEKPSRERAGPHRLASTGIYVFDPMLYPVVAEVHARKSAQNVGGLSGPIELDFARDVFPAVLDEARRCPSGPGIRALELEGYWNDVGTPGQYFQAIRDILAGRVNLPSLSTPPDMDPSGVVYWKGGRGVACAAGARARGNVLVLPLANESPPR